VDLGRIDRTPAPVLLPIEAVFVSHTHMDHFMGFDQLLRIFLARDTTLRLYGPAGLADCVEGKLAGYTWNLTDEYAFTIEVTDIGERQMTGWLARRETPAGHRRATDDRLAFRGAPPVRARDGRSAPAVHRGGGRRPGLHGRSRAARSPYRVDGVCRDRAHASECAHRRARGLGPSAWPVAQRAQGRRAR